MKQQSLIKRYRSVLIMLVSYSILFFISSTLFNSAIEGSIKSLTELLIVVPPIFILIGLLDVWVEREKMTKLMGVESKGTGMLIAFLLGSVAAGPLYAAFPVAITLLKKGSSFRNVLIMLGAWSTTKIPMLMFEFASMGTAFTITRFMINLVGILAIALISERVLSEKTMLSISEKFAEN
jgi:uncharacterized membrane protein YraQ (UPF0718 family)